MIVGLWTDSEDHSSYGLPLLISGGKRTPGKKKNKLANRDKSTSARFSWDIFLSRDSFLGTFFVDKQVLRIKIA